MTKQLIDNNLLDESNSELINLFKADPTHLISQAKQLSEVLNNISKALQLLEDGLREINANFPFNIKVEEDPQSCTKKPEVYHTMTSPYDILGYRTQVEWRISWEEDDDSNAGKFRLFLIGVETETIYYNLPTDPDDVGSELFQKKIVFKKPLRQTKIPVRLQFSKYLNIFIKLFENHLETNRNKIEKGDFSISLVVPIKSKN